MPKTNEQEITVLYHGHREGKPPTKVTVSVNFDRQSALIQSHLFGSFVYSLMKEPSKSRYGGLQPGTGIRNWNRFIKAYNAWDRKDYNGLAALMIKYQVTKWAIN